MEGGETASGVENDKVQLSAEASFFCMSNRVRKHEPYPADDKEQRKEEQLCTSSNIYNINVELRLTMAFQNMRAVQLLSFKIPESAQAASRAQLNQGAHEKANNKTSQQRKQEHKLGLST